mmetsp:Transcript_21338/g.27995  ORF Transcript_21338/g.27995 Transcript_21338/m.27995 type:complete len:86 (-) Transcript_21338:199-456(-)
MLRTNLLKIRSDNSLKGSFSSDIFRFSLFPDTLRNASSYHIYFEVKYKVQVSDTIDAMKKKKKKIEGKKGKWGLPLFIYPLGIQY